LAESLFFKAPRKRWMNCCGRPLAGFERLSFRPGPPPSSPFHFREPIKSFELLCRAIQGNIVKLGPTVGLFQCGPSLSYILTFGSASNHSTFFHFVRFFFMTALACSPQALSIILTRALAVVLLFSPPWYPLPPPIPHAKRRANGFSAQLADAPACSHLLLCRQHSLVFPFQPAFHLILTST